MGIQAAETLGIKKWEKVYYYYQTVKVKENNDTYTVLMSNYVSDIAYVT